MIRSRVHTAPPAWAISASSWNCLRDNVISSPATTTWCCDRWISTSPTTIFSPLAPTGGGAPPPRPPTPRTRAPRHPPPHRLTPQAPPPAGNATTPAHAPPPPDPPLIAHPL